MRRPAELQLWRMLRPSPQAGQAEVSWPWSRCRWGRHRSSCWPRCVASDRSCRSEWSPATPSGSVRLPAVTSLRTRYTAAPATGSQISSAAAARSREAFGRCFPLHSLSLCCLPIASCRPAIPLGSRRYSSATLSQDACPSYWPCRWNHAFRPLCRTQLRTGHSSMRTSDCSLAAAGCF